MRNCPDGRLFVVIDGEDLCEPRHGEDVVDKGGQSKDPEASSFCLYGLCGLEYDPEPGTGDIFCTGEIAEQGFGLPGGEFMELVIELKCCDMVDLEGHYDDRNLSFGSNFTQGHDQFLNTLLFLCQYNNLVRFGYGKPGPKGGS